MSVGRKTWRKQKSRICANCKRTIENQRMYYLRWHFSDGRLFNPQYEIWEFYSCKDCGPEIILVSKDVGYFRSRYSMIGD